MQPERKSQRKHGYDYSQPGYYAVAVCTQNRSCLFGVIDNGDMRLNDAGRMIDETWHEIPHPFPNVELDVMQIMPNHLHGIIVVREVGADLCVRPNPGIENGQTQRSVPTPLSNVIKRFKMLTTRRYIDGVNKNGWYSFSGKLWQRSYYDRIIRNEAELTEIRTYICNNPIGWDTDENYIEIQDRTCPCNETSLSGRS